MIRGAGGVVLRDGEVLLVHRPKYGDWSLPKGKHVPGETDEQCALREIKEETGLDCEIVRRLGESHYRAQAGPKVVHWFLMRPLAGTFRPHDEVDEIAWVPLAEARSVVTFDAGLEQLERL